MFLPYNLTIFVKNRVTTPLDFNSRFRISEDEELLCNEVCSAIAALLQCQSIFQAVSVHAKQSVACDALSVKATL